MEGFFRGIQGFGQAFRFMLRHRMGWMFLVPVILWLLFAFGLYQAGSALAGSLQTWGAAHLGLQVPAVDRQGLPGFWDDAKAFLNGARNVVLWIALKLVVFRLIALVGKYVVLILLSPLLSYASERTEEILTGNAMGFSAVRWAKEMLRGMLMAMRNGGVELGINVLVWAITLFLPVLAPLSALFLWLVSCWFYGFSMFDYIHERRRLGLRASVRAARERRGMVLANGMLFNLLMKVPLLGMVAAPLLAAVGAVLADTPKAAATMPAPRP